MSVPAIIPPTAAAPTARDDVEPRSAVFTMPALTAAVAERISLIEAGRDERSRHPDAVTRQARR